MRVIANPTSEPSLVNYCTEVGIITNYGTQRECILTVSVASQKHTKQ